MKITKNTSKITNNKTLITKITKISLKMKSRKTPTNNIRLGRNVVSRLNSDLEAFSHNSTHGSFAALAFQRTTKPVSYTHLTLPTIYSV